MENMYNISGNSIIWIRTYNRSVAGFESCHVDRGVALLDLQSDKPPNTKWKTCITFPVITLYDIELAVEFLMNFKHSK